MDPLEIFVYDAKKMKRQTPATKELTKEKGGKSLKIGWATETTNERNEEEEKEEKRHQPRRKKVKGS